MQRFHVSATGHSVNYLPEYVAVRKGFFEEEGLNVTASVPTPWDIVLDDLATGRADAALGGIWVPAMHFGRGTRYVPFAQVSARAPLAILGREPADDFAWSGAAGKVFAMKGSNGASIGIFTKMLLADNGVDLHKVGFIQDLDGGILSRTFAGGMADYLVLDYPSALALARAGVGHVVACYAAVGGDVPWSVYYSEGAGEEARIEMQVRFVRALDRGMRWLLERRAEEYSDFLKATFPRFDEALLVDVVETYRANGMWTSPRIDRTAFDRWQWGIVRGHLIDRPIAYDDLIDTRPLESSPTRAPAAT